MKEVKHKSHKIVIYDTAENMPIKRYQRFNKFLMIDNEVGSDFNDFELRSAKTLEYLKKGMFEQAIKEMENRRQAVFNAYSEYSPKHRSLALLIHSIDDEVYDDISDSGLQKVIDKLNEIGYTQKQANETATEVKKKIETELNLYFPGEFKNNEKIEFGIKFKELLVLEFEKLAGKKIEEKEIDNLERDLLRMEEPGIWNINIPGNMEVQMETEFDKYLISVSEFTNENINEMSVFRFYSLISLLKEKNNKKQ